MKSMKTTDHALDIKAQKNLKAPLAPIVSVFNKQKDGSYLLGTLFADKALQKVKVQKSGLSIEDLELEKKFDADMLGVSGGARGTETGDTALAVLHKGSAPLFGFMKKAKAPQSEEEVWEDIAEDRGGLGFSYKHSIVQIIDANFQIRRLKDAGALLDAAHIGDFIFGMNGNAIFREPYLNAEKRYVMRDDLLPNYRLHKVEDGVFWLLGNDFRLMKANLTDNKALPTTKKVPDAPFHCSVDCAVDGWLYGLAGRTLFRVRVNSENRLDELQVVHKWETEWPTSIAVVESTQGDEGEKALLWVAVKGDTGATIYEIQTEKAADAEALPPVPPLSKIYEDSDALAFQHLSALDEKSRVAVVKKKDGAFFLRIFS